MKYFINTIFPKTFICSNIGRQITEEELNVVAENAIPGATYKNTGNLNSIQRYLLNDRTEFSSIRTFIEDGIKNYIDTVIKPKDDVKFYITQSWLNYTKPGEYHHKHDHPNSLLSGVFYFNADKEKDRIYFYDDKDYQRLKLEATEWNLYNSRSWWYPVGTGDLVIFKSELTHMVDTTVSDQTRISLAFNVFAKGAFGTEETLTAVYL
jgi:uncharacterized protein (TIGR02466 family)